MTKKLIKTFILTTIVIMLLIIILLLFYIIKFKGSEEKELENVKNSGKTVKTEQTNLLNKELPDAANEEVIRGVIFIGDKEDEDLISSAYFVNFDSQENKISFYNFPGDMKFEVSNELYKEISTSLVNMPQVLTLSHLYKYSKNKQGLKAGMLMLDDYLELGMSHYLFLKAKDAEKIFYFNPKGDSTFLQSFVNGIVNGSKSDKNEFVKEIYNSKLTDIKKEAYIEILDKLHDVNRNNIRFITIQGERFDNGVIVKKEDLIN